MRGLQDFTFYGIGGPGFKDAASELSKRGPCYTVVQAINANNSEQRNKEPLSIKKVANPDQILPYIYDENGKYIPQSTTRIIFSPFVRVTNGKLTLSDSFLRHINDFCPMCGESFCGMNAKKCVYAGITPSFNMCNLCYRGMHESAQCRASMQQWLNSKQISNFSGFGL